MAFPSDSARTKNWNTEILTDADLEGQLDILHSYFVASLNSTTGHSHDGTSNQGPKINISNLTVSSQATGDIYYASSSTANARLAIGTAGKFLQVNSGATAPEWDTLVVADMPAGSVVQVVTTETSAVVTCATTGTTWDDSIPAITDGVQILSRTITPTHASNLLYFFVSGHGACDSGANTTVHLHKDGAAAVAAIALNIGNYSGNFKLEHSEAAGSTSSQTWTVRLNPSSGGNTVYVNGDTSGTRLFGGVGSTKITIVEVKV